MFFDSWSDVLRVLAMGALAYFALVAILRVSGKRTLAKMNAFDLVVTVALGSTLATILLTRDVAFVEGVAALLVLVLLQYVVATLMVRSAFVARLAKSEARPLLADGIADRGAMRDERVTYEEVLAAIRSAGIGDVAHVAAVVLETDGSFSVVARPRGHALRAAAGAPRLNRRGPPRVCP